MKAALLALALFSSCIFAAQAGSGRQLFQAPTGAPADCPTVFDVAEENGLTTLVEAMHLDELEASLDNSTGYPLTYTVFAPTNDAFDALTSALGVSLEDLRDSGELDDVLQYHFLITPYTENQLVQLGTVGTNFRNTTLSISTDGVITGAGSNATIVTPNVQACESIIHVIDNVLLPDFNAVAPPSGAPASASA